MGDMKNTPNTINGDHDGSDCGEDRQTKKSIASQFVATIGLNLMLIDLVMAISFSTIVIPALLNGKDSQSVSFTAEQASWFGSVYTIAQPFGSVISGLTLEPFGRKKVLLLVNIPRIVAWIVISLSPNIEILFLGNMLLGLATGFMEAPILSYSGEISHPSMRGVISSLCQALGNFGSFLVYFLGSVMDWRGVALISAGVPTLTFLMTIFIPETPLWLVTQGKKDEAMKSLCWVRGWTKPERVRREFDQIVAYQVSSAQCDKCPSAGAQNCIHKNPGFLNKCKRTYEDVSRKEMMRPIALIVFSFACQQAAGLMPTRPNTINLYRCFGFTIDGYLAMVITGSIGVINSFVLFCAVRHFGKRKLFLFSMLSCAVSAFALGTYAFAFVDANTSSYDVSTIKGELPHSWIPMTVFAFYNLFGMGTLTLPWIIICEIFPLRGKGMAAGLCAAMAYAISSIASKTYYNLETALGINGVFWFYSALSFFGSAMLYLYLPETEGKSFEEIEKNFSGKHFKMIPNNCVTKFIGGISSKDFRVYNDNGNLANSGNQFDVNITKL